MSLDAVLPTPSPAGSPSSAANLSAPQPLTPGNVVTGIICASDLLYSRTFAFAWHAAGSDSTAPKRKPVQGETLCSSVSDSAVTAYTLRTGPDQKPLSLDLIASNGSVLKSFPLWGSVFLKPGRRHARFSKSSPNEELIFASIQFDVVHHEQRQDAKSYALIIVNRLTKAGDVYPPSVGWRNAFVQPPCDAGFGECCEHQVACRRPGACQ